MRTRWYMRCLTAVMVPVLTAISAGAQELQLHGRVSFDSKGMLVRGTGDKDWERATLNTLLMPGDALWVDQGGLSEVELAGGSFLRLADGSKAELQALPPTADVRGWVGSFYVQRISRSQGSFILTTPSCQVDVAIDSCVRVDIDEKGGATVSVRWGGAEVRTDAGAPVRLSDTQRLWVDPGFLPSDPVGFDRAESDSFDQWNNDRATLLANSYKTLPKEVAIPAPVEGVADLGSYGEWVYVDNRPCWRPTVVVDYVPYRYGCWNYCPSVGNVWVGAYPFCYVTSHYGRWSHAAAYGWVWSYDPVWSPAWATTVCAGDYLMWAPMGWDSRPVMITESAHFGLGGVDFCVSSTSWMPMSYVTTGWAPISACTPMFADTICTLPVAQINVWNIYGDDHHRPHPHPFDSNVFHERNYNPPRSIRGIAAPHDGPAPGERAHALEARMGREHFAPLEHTGGRMERSAAGHGASLRSVRLDNVSALQPDTAPGLAEMRRSSAGRELRTGSDNGMPAMTNHTAAGAQLNNQLRSNTGPLNDVPALRSEGRTAVRGEARTMGAVPDGMNVNSGSGNDHALRGGPSTTALRGTASGRASLRDIDPGTPAPGGPTRFQATPDKTPVRGSVRTMQGASSTGFTGPPHVDSGVASSPASGMSNAPTFPTTRSSRPLSFDTDASRLPAPRAVSSHVDRSIPRSENLAPRVESAPRIEAQTPMVQQHSEPSVSQPRFEAPQSRIQNPQPRFDRGSAVPQPRFEAPQPRIETPQPHFEAPQPRIERSAPVQQPHFEAPQPHFEAPRVAPPSMSSRSNSPDTNNSSSSSSGSHGGIRGR